MMISQRYRDSRTGEIKTLIPLMEIPYFDEYNGPLEAGDTDTEFETIRDQERKHYGENK